MTLGKKNYKTASMHFSNQQASTHVWNNFRDQKFEFDWQHMFQQSQNNGNILFLTNQRQRKHFFLLEHHARIVCVLKFVQSRLQHRLREIEEKFEGIQFLKSYIIPSNQFTIRIPPQHSI